MKTNNITIDMNDISNEKLEILFQFLLGVNVKKYNYTNYDAAIEIKKYVDERITSAAKDEVF